MRIFSILTTLVLVVACNMQQADVILSFDGPVERVVIDAGRADIVIVGTDRADGAEIHDTSRYNREAPELGVSLVDGELRIAPSCPGGAGVAVTCDVQLTVEVPAGVEVSGKTGSGDLQVEAIDGDVTLAAESGDVHLADLSGAVEVSGGQGDIVGEGLRAAVLSASASSGDLELAFAGVPASVWLETRSGDVTLTVPKAAYDVRIGASPDEVSVSGIDRVADAPATIEVASDSGDITVRGQ